MTTNNSQPSKDKSQIYFEAWAGLWPNLELDKNLLASLKFTNTKDLILHISNVFLFAMFYECIDGDKSIPDLRRQETFLEDNCHGVEGNPAKWLEFYQGDNCSYFAKHIYNNVEYVVMHSGLFKMCNDIYCLFAPDIKSPYKLIAIGNAQGCLYCRREFARNIAEEIFEACDKCVPLKYFKSVSDVIFDCTLLGNWDNPAKISMNENHLKKDHKERVSALGERNLEKGIEQVKWKCTEACKRTITNYRYAYPYLYFHGGSSKIRRGFLLPLMNRNRVALVACVMKDTDSKSNSNRYRINTFLTPEMAIEQARRVSSVEVDWMSKILEK